MTYEELIAELKELSEETFAAFQKKLIFTKAEILGVRTPVLRKLAKRLENEAEYVFSFPDDYYEVTFLKLAIAAKLPFDLLCDRLDSFVRSIDNWSTCDTFKPQCFLKHKKELLPFFERYFSWHTEFSERFVLVMLLKFFEEEKDVCEIERYLYAADADLYYVCTGAAWLLAETVIRFPKEGERILRDKRLDERIRKKAVQKARESFRVSPLRKQRLQKLK